MLTKNTPANDVKMGPKIKWISTALDWKGSASSEFSHSSVLGQKRKTRQRQVPATDSGHPISGGWLEPG